ncbi:hypothetical protein [Streptomyces lycii]|uniref:Uncharacterized protein n=1 Tax=Streptomyces lycii TaxID=2654337 RepID=A0ABQ7FL97_9ACTN|nr:hypothetical protein [Streptomyces lycii]KAF4408546.1 hypothetical protein GCU69_14055 [Streptomyces lycii]
MTRYGYASRGENASRAVVHRTFALLQQGDVRPLFAQQGESRAGRVAEVDPIRFFT